MATKQQRHKRGDEGNRRNEDDDDWKASEPGHGEGGLFGASATGMRAVVVAVAVDPWHGGLRKALLNRSRSVKCQLTRLGYIHVGSGAHKQRTRRQLYSG